jgi:mannose-6-phosphate isomerase
MRENKALAKALEWTEHVKIDAEWVKHSVKKMFYEIDSDADRLE